MDNVTVLSPWGERPLVEADVVCTDAHCISPAFGVEELPARLRVPGKLSISSRKDDGRESGDSRLLWDCNEENSQNIQAFSQVKVLVGGTLAAEEAEQGGLAG